MAALETELESFRQEWRTELEARGTILEGSSSTAKLSDPGQLRPHTSNRPQKTLHGKSALQLFGEAARAEAEGDLSWAVLAYRKAFKIDPDVDHAHHHAQSKAADQAKVDSDVDPLSFDFARTLQLGPDFKASKDEDSDDHHPSSTQRQVKHLLESIRDNPWVSPDSSSGAIVESAAETTFIQATNLRPCSINKLPDEIISLVMLQLALPDIPRGFPKLGPVERFAQTCRKARLLTLQDATVWKTACQVVLVPPYQVEPVGDKLADKTKQTEAERICRMSHGSDWRRAWIEQPKIRTDGCFISVVSYLRRGEADNVWIQPSHIVVYYRFLRFFPDGRLISLVTTVSPSEIARSIDVGLKMKGMQIGRWHLRGDQISCWDLEDRLVDEPKYTIEMSYRLKSTQRGKMNKLVLNSLWTSNKRTHETVEVPLQHNKSFFFSCVRSYEGF